MAKAKFTYDENGATFLYFVLSFLALILIPTTYYLWPNDEQNDEKQKGQCRCNGCQNKHQQLGDLYKWKKTRRRFVRPCIIVGWVLFFIVLYKSTTIQNEYINWNPFEILGVQENSSSEEIKKAYRKLSLIYHPDKYAGDSDTFVQITKAYSTLTDETARKNWEEYGHPEGPRVASFGIALPSWIVEKENSFVVLGIYALIFMVALPVSVGLWWYKSVKFGCDKVLISTSELFYYFIHRTPHMALKKVIMIISAAFEFAKTHNSEVVERPSDNVEVPRLMRDLTNLGEKNKERPLCYSYSIKTRAILHAHLSRMKLPPNTLELDRRFIVRKCPYLIQEFVQCVSQLITLALSGRIGNKPALVTLENSMKLSALTVQALWEYQSPLLQLPHVTEETIKALTKKNVKSIEQIARMDDKQRRDLFKNFTDQQFEDLEFVMSSMPYLKVDMKFEVLDDEEPHIITSGSIVTVTVNLKRMNLAKVRHQKQPAAGDDVHTKTNQDENQNHSADVANNHKSGDANNKSEDNSSSSNRGADNSSNSSGEDQGHESHPVHCPYFPDNKQEFWWVYLVDRKRLALVTAPLLVKNLKDTETVTLKFTAPGKPQTYAYTIVIRSDSYMDCTVQETVRIDVKPAPDYVQPDYGDISEDEVDECDEDSAVDDPDLLTDSD